MSIFKFVTYKTPVVMIRSFFFQILAIVFAVSMGSITCQASSVISTQDIYHKHTGNSNGGGCYTVQKTDTKSEEVSCGGAMVYFPAQNESKCSKCAASYTGDQSHRSCWHSDIVYTDYTYYEVGCNMGTSAPVGKLILEKSTESWARSIQLIASYQVPEGMELSSSPYVWNGGQPSNQNVYTVTGNGNYSLTLAPNDNMTTGTAVVSVNNIDTTAPIIRSHQTEFGTGWAIGSVVVTLGTVEDKQPDGSNGSGLHEKAYSYDNGKTWTSQGKYEYTANGTYTILVRDKVGNMSSYSVKINNIDITAPIIRSHKSDPGTEWTAGSVMVTIGTVEDKQPDGSNGSGLHEEAYSYDNGRTWIAWNQHEYTENGTYTIKVRDKLCNTSSYKVVIKNLDKTAPVLRSHKSDPEEGWTAKSVVVTLGGTEDKQPDGSNGSGMHEKPYSYDNGKTWTSQGKHEYTENGTYTVIVRDKVGNESLHKVEITNLDKTAPVLHSYKAEPLEEWTAGSVAVTLGNAEDKQPDGSNGCGLHDTPYSYDNGKTWTAEREYVYAGNGTYKIMVRDKLENTSSYEVLINNIDQTAPMLSGHIIEPAEEWTKESVRVILKDATDKQPDGSDGCGLHDTAYSYDNGGTWTSETEYIYTENGTYEVLLRDKLENTSSYEVSVSNIDKTAPVLSGHVTEPGEEWTKENVKVMLKDAEDKQPDGSDGCGLHNTPYSYDNGGTWTSETEYLYSENGTYEILIQDVLENVSSYDVTIKNIDKTIPVIEAVEYDKTANVKDVTIKVTASDKQPDGSEGSGLHDTAYSFDGGNTWIAEPVWKVDKNEAVTIAVRDKLDNIVYEDIVISNIDCFSPVISYEMVEDTWTNKDVQLHLQAHDTNEDGSKGAGLADKWYSLDGGVTWTNKAVQTYDKNQRITVIARDRNNNQSELEIDINQIDKDLPRVSLKKEVVGSGDEMIVRIIATADDEGSGLHKEAYSWDRGKTFGNGKSVIVKKNGNYQVTVRDKAGNKKIEKISVKEFPVRIRDLFVKKDPIIEEDEQDNDEQDTDEQDDDEQNDDESDNDKPENKEPKKEESQKAEEQPVIEEPVKKKPITEKEADMEIVCENTYIEEPEIEEETVTQEIRKEEPVIQKVKKQEENHSDWKELLLLLSVIIGVLIFLLLLGILWIRTIAVYVEDERGNMKYLGRQWIHCKDERYEVHFGNVLLEKCVTTHFELRPNILFVILHKGKEIVCLFPEDICIIKEVEKRVDISLL